MWVEGMLIHGNAQYPCEGDKHNKLIRMGIYVPCGLREGDVVKFDDIKYKVTRIEKHLQNRGRGPIIVNAEPWSEPVLEPVQKPAHELKPVGSPPSKPVEPPPPPEPPSAPKTTPTWGEGVRIIEI